jgi:anti-sigma regulatory factor (Ser/Thr protein kinase)
VTARESIPAPLRLAISGPSAIHDATEAARKFADASGIDGADRSRLAIIVEELVTNLYDHGGLGTGDVFGIELSATDSDIGVIITDRGRAFDPRTAPLDLRIPSKGAGAGLRLVRDWATHADYHRTGGQNRLALVLPRSARRD